MSLLKTLFEKMEALGIQPKRSLGQNFLVSEFVIDKILAAVAKRQASHLLEIGPGLGALTDHLQKMNSSFEVIELDRIFAQMWREKGLKVHEVDALALDWKTLNLPNPTLLVSNLPYQISSSIVIERSVWPCNVQSMVLMFQKEVAQRIMAKASTEDYGLLTVIAQVFWNIEIVADAGARDFFPPPKIASRVLAFDRKENPGVLNPQMFLKFVKSAFQQRRKMMVKNLSTFVGGRDPKLKEELVNHPLAANGVRAEALSPQDLLQLYCDLFEKKEVQ